VKAKAPAHKSAAWKPARKSVRQAEAALPPPPAAEPAPPSSPAAAPAPPPAAEPGPPGPPKLTGPAVVHWEIQASDAAAQGRFFAELFSWDIDASYPDGYGVVTPAGVGSIGGGIAPSKDHPRTTFYVQVPDINASLAKAESLGAQTVMPRTDVGMIIMAKFRDPEGNLIGLVEG
jgi:predicted enzyme related to lactoylglutathione lyase